MKIKTNDFIIYFPNKMLQEIMSYSGSTEKIGYILGNKIKDVEEYSVKGYSEPHKRDISLIDYSEVSWSHKRKVRKIMKRNNNQIYPLGFWHTHPNWYGVRPSDTDLKHFKTISRNDRNNIFIIATKHLYSIYIYRNSKCIFKTERKDVDNDISD